MENTNKKYSWLLPVIILICLNIICGWFLNYYNNRIHADIEKLKESVVLINSCDRYGARTASGSGVISYTNNEVITCYHVINQDKPGFEVLLNDGSTVKVKSIVAYNVELDLAVLSLEKEVEAKPLAVTACRMKPGDEVFTISSPSGELNIVSKGTYEGITEHESTGLITTTAKVSPGSSGGALFDKNGNLIGIISRFSIDKSHAVPAIKTDDILQENRVDCEMKEFYNARKKYEPIIISVEELLNTSQEYHAKDVIVYGFIQKIDGQTIYITSNTGETDVILTVNIGDITDIADLEQGRAVYATGLFLNATERPILYARILEIKDELEVY